MGYLVSNLLAVNADDKHTSFIYFTPGRNFEYQWIDDWVAERFAAVAARLGPEAVIVAPSTGSEDLSRNAMHSFFDERADIADSFQPSKRVVSTLLHTGFPFFVISRRPLREGPPSNGEEFIAINAAGFDQQGLGRFFDDLIETVNTGGDVLALDVPDFEPLDKWARRELDFVMEDAIQLKPNVFGVGLDLNAVWRYFSDRRKSSHRD